jgi:branched-chain amino acid transport system ATP-binding protein
MILTVENVSKTFGGLSALTRFNLEVKAGEILGLIGPNGSGKTTLFNVISGFFPPSTGRILFNGREITGLRADQIARRGLVRTFQGTALFSQRTVMDNLIIAHHLMIKAGFLGLLLNLSKARREETAVRKSALDILTYLDLMAVKDEAAHNLPHGHQRALGVAIALAAQPRLLLLDEPLTGMNPEESRKFIGLIRGLTEKGITLMVVEHDMKAIMEASERIVVLNYGEKIAEGTPQEIQNNTQVIEAYLGGEGWDA